MLCMAALLGGCTAKLEARVAALEEQQQRVQQIADEARDKAASLEIELENESRRASREKYCQSGKIAQFMEEIQAGLPDACTPIRLADALNFMYKLPAAITHLDPSGPLTLRKARLGQIRYILDPEKLHPSTRLLVLAKPQEDTPAARNHALELGRQLISDVLRKELPPPRPLRPKESAVPPREVPILGPYLLPCELSSSIEVLYKKAFYHSISGEPPLGKPAVVLFVFVSDC